MTDVASSEAALTEEVVARFDATPDPRLREIMQSLVRHLHAFALDVKLDLREWEQAIGFLTAVGHITDDKRQEFILLSDTLGLSMLVDSITNGHQDGATETTVLGPFYVPPLEERPHGSDIAEGTVGTPLEVKAQVLDTDGAPVADAWVDVWQSDDDGYYDVQKPGQTENLRARFRTDAEGRLHFRSIVPTSYPIPTDGPVGKMLVATNRHPYRPAHMHFMIGKDGYETLVTHLFISGDEYLESDAVFGVKRELIVDLADAPNGSDKLLDYTFGLKPARG